MPRAVKQASAYPDAGSSDEDMVEDEVDPRIEINRKKAGKRRAAGVGRTLKPKKVRPAQQEIDDNDDDVFGDSADDDEDGEYTGDAEVVLREKSRSKSRALNPVRRAPSSRLS